MKNSKILISLILILITVYCFVRARKGGDFDVYLHAGEKIIQEQNIYKPPFVKGLQYYYSPTFALFLAPFSSIPKIIPEFIWLLLSIYFLYRIWIISMTFFPKIPEFSIKENYWWIGLTLFFVLRFILMNIAMIQMTIFLIWASLETIFQIEKKNYLLSGLILAIAINIKLMPLIVLPYILFRNHLISFCYTLACSLLLLVAPYLFLKHEYITMLYSEWWQIINPTNQEHMIETGNGTHSLVSLIPVYITDTVGNFEYKRNFINLSIETTHLVVNISRLILVFFTFWFLRTLPFKKEFDKLKIYWEVSYLLLVTPLLFPHQQKYAFMYIAPAIIYLVYVFIYKIKNNEKIWFKISVLLIFSIIFSPLIGSDVIGRFMHDLVEHYRILSISTFVLMVYLALYSPNKIQNTTKSI